MRACGRRMKTRGSKGRGHMQLLLSWGHCRWNMQPPPPPPAAAAAAAAALAAGLVLGRAARAVGGAEAQ